MKKFRFTLQALLTVRQQAEQNTLEAYARALATRQEARDRVTTVQRELSEAWQDLSQELTAGTSAAQVSLSQAWCQVLEQRHTAARRQLQDTEAALQKAHQNMLAARQDREAVESYQDNQRRRYDRELMREEQKTLDDLVNSRLVPAFSWKDVANNALN